MNIKRWLLLTHGAVTASAGVLGAIAWHPAAVLIAAPLAALWPSIYALNLTALRLGAMLLPVFLAIGVMEIVANPPARIWGALLAACSVVDTAAIVAALRSGAPQYLANERNR